MRNEFAKDITRHVFENKSIVLLSGDIGNKLFNNLKENCPDNFYNCGVAEANMIGVAAGLALSGLRPVCYTITPFLTTRCAEQIKLDVCYHKAPVILVGTGAGLSYASLGPSHHSLEDIALMRMMPGMTVLCPCDAIELKFALSHALRLNSPVYIRIGKKGEPVFHKTIPEFTIGKPIEMQKGKVICFLSTGNIMPLAFEAAALLNQKGFKPQIYSFHTVKPLNSEALHDIFTSFDCVVTLEEHSKIGGFGAAVAEWYAENSPLNNRLISFSAGDWFLHEIGSQSYARARYGLTASNVAGKVLDYLSVRNRD